MLQKLIRGIAIIRINLSPIVLTAFLVHAPKIELPKLRYIDKAKIFRLQSLKIKIYVCDNKKNLHTADSP